MGHLKEEQKAQKGREPSDLEKSVGKWRETEIKELPKYKETVTILVWLSLHLTAVRSPQ